jgi:hypothetical protein
MFQKNLFSYFIWSLLGSSWHWFFYNKYSIIDGAIYCKIVVIDECCCLWRHSIIVVTDNHWCCWYWHQYTPSIVDTGGKFTAGLTATNVNLWKFANLPPITEVNLPPALVKKKAVHLELQKVWQMFEKIWNGDNKITMWPGENDPLTKSRDTVPWSVLLLTA